MSRCVVCGCTDERACAEGCSWTVNNGECGVCSACAEGGRLRVLRREGRRLFKEALRPMTRRARMEKVEIRRADLLALLVSHVLVKED